MEVINNMKLSAYVGYTAILQREITQGKEREQRYSTMLALMAVLEFAPIVAVVLTSSDFA